MNEISTRCEKCGRKLYPVPEADERPIVGPFTQWAPKRGRIECRRGGRHNPLDALQYMGRAIPVESTGGPR